MATRKATRSKSISPGTIWTTSSNVGVVDAGALIAAVDGADKHHAAVVAHLDDRSWRWVVPALCLAEAAYIVGQKYGPMVEADFIMSLASIEVRAPERDDWAPIAATIRQYHGFNIGAADASMMQLAERLQTTTLLTLDRRHFNAVRPLHARSWHLLPEI